MLNIVQAFNQLRRDQKGASAVEYAILVGAVGAAVGAAVLAYKPLLATLFTGMITTAGG